MKQAYTLSSHSVFIDNKILRNFLNNVVISEMQNQQNETNVYGVHIWKKESRRWAYIF